MTRKSSESNVRKVPLADIRIDGGTQIRARLDEDTVQEYAAAVEAEEPMPVARAVFDGSHYWLWDGFHRYHAHGRAGLGEMLVEVTSGTRRDAVLLACGANSRHGLKRNDDDKRNAVRTLLEDGEWSQWSDREIARRCGNLSPTFVGNLRRILTVHVDSENSLANGASDAHLSTRTDAPGRPRLVERGGTTYTQDTSNIGRRRSDEVPDDDERDWSDEEDDLAAPAAPATPIDEDHAFFHGDATTPPAGAAIPMCPAGLPLPADKAEAFAALASFRELELHLRKAQKLADVLSRHPGGMFYDRRLEHRKRAGKGDDELRATSLHVANAIRELVGEQPHASTCPYCAHDGEVRPDCQACLGQDWVTRGTWESAPDDYRDEAVVMAQGRLGRAEA